jgi:hypothetical protein
LVKSFTFWDTVLMHIKTPSHSRSLVHRSPVFYGWIVWLVAAIGIAATSPGQSFSVSLFIDHYITDFGLDRTTISALYGIGTFTASLALTWVGRRIDRHGNRRMSVVLITLLFGLALLASARVSGPLTILLSFIAIRSLGQGSLGLVSTTAVAQWFRRKRGWVMGLALVTYAVFQRFYLPWMQEFITANGWRAAWLLTGAVLLLGVLPLLALLLRDQPEDFGLQPDGAAPPPPRKLHRSSKRTGNYAKCCHPALLGLQRRPHARRRLGHGAHLSPDFPLRPARPQPRRRRRHLRPCRPDDRRHHPRRRLAGRPAAPRLRGRHPNARPRRRHRVDDDHDGNLAAFPYTIAFGIFLGFGSVFDGTVWVNLFGRRHQGAIRGFVATTG